MGAEAAYLSLNRGEGGQNLIGPELGEALGLLRTEELLAARRLDGAGQYFTRAYDFGFSKTLDETWSHWPRDTILKDVVRIVRRFRPQVLVSIFSGTPSDGHGQHQAAGWAAREAFRIAGDSTRFPELEREEGLQPWTPLKLYREHPVRHHRHDAHDGRRRARLGRGAVVSPDRDGGAEPAPLAGHGTAAADRALEVRLALVEDRTGEGRASLFAGVDTLLPPGPEPPDQRPPRGGPGGDVGCALRCPQRRRPGGSRPDAEADGRVLEHRECTRSATVAIDGAPRV